MNVSSPCSFSKFSLSPKVLSVKKCLLQCVDMFEELMTSFDQLSIEADTYRAELMTQKEKCNSKSCPGSEAIKQEMSTKENIITAAASYLTKLSDTKHSNVFGELLRILQGESCTPTPPKDILGASNLRVKVEHKDIPIMTEMICPKRNLSSSFEDVSFKEDSVTEIDATPTGKKSPVLQPRKLKNAASANESDCREKKKCPDEWPSPRAKLTKIKFEGCTPVRARRSRQARLPWAAAKRAAVVDLTARPDLGEGSLTLENAVHKIIKKESSENDDTILPSPTSGSSILFGFSTSKEKSESRRPLSLKSRGDKNDVIENKQIKIEEDNDVEDMEVSINILQPVRLPRHPKQSPMKVRPEPVDDATHCDTLASVSLLQHVGGMERDQENLHRVGRDSPKKRPLAENVNAGNVPSESCDAESSISILNATPAAKMAADTTTKKTPEKVEPVYKEPTVRKKAEKMALPGWVCDECKQFFGVLYKDEPDMVAKCVARCSRHRGRARPATPPGYWRPRWAVPDDTEEFNRRNDAR